MAAPATVEKQRPSGQNSQGQAWRWDVHRSEEAGPLGTPCTGAGCKPLPRPCHRPSLQDVPAPCPGQILGAHKQEHLYTGGQA